jgi:RNA polymerase sigma-32 factor
VSKAPVSDPFDVYLREVRRHPLLTVEEERELTRRYAETRDPADARRLVESNLRLVVKLARDYARGRVPMIDLVQEGNIGLMHAVEKFDPTREVRFATYAVWWIRAQVLRYLMANQSLLRFGNSKTQRQLFYNLKKEQARLEAKGIKPTAKSVAKELQVDTMEVLAVQARLSPRTQVSLDAPFGDDEQGASLSDRLPAGGLSVEEQAERADLKTQLHRELDAFAETLDERDRVVWDRRVRSQAPVTLRELGDEIGVTGERVRMLEMGIRKSLKRWLKQHLPDVTDL